MDGQPAEYFNWKFDEPNGGIDELCATMAYDGEWQDLTCSSHRQSVCSDGSHYYITETEMTWMDAVANCEAKNSSLVQIQNSTMNNEIMNLLSSATEVWIGLNTSVDWYWADTGKSATFLNWQEGQPDNLSGNESCAAMETENGTWTDEHVTSCTISSAKNKFTGGVGSTAVETKVQKSKQTVVKLKIQTRVNMEDPAASAILEEQWIQQKGNQENNRTRSHHVNEEVKQKTFFRSVHFLFLSLRQTVISMMDPRYIV
ncbi:neurocan core protein-like [Melanotaenia boesemani]|uniref:neurocan core protein-like n=1 Tax=Melanotaenia boesemani TaxID=1250792 RepID=UPI001C04FF8A|nr:neurocan core protein-like [Melanotaenia boesemani]